MNLRISFYFCNFDGHIKTPHFKRSSWFSIFAKALAVMGQMRAMKKMRVKQVPLPSVGFDRGGFCHNPSSLVP